MVRYRPRALMPRFRRAATNRENAMLRGTVNTVYHRVFNRDCQKKGSWNRARKFSSPTKPFSPEIPQS